MSPDGPSRRDPDAESAETPRLSVVLATPRDLSTLRETLRHLKAQTLRRSLELVIVAPKQQRLDLRDADLCGFARCLLVELDEVSSIGAANAAGILRATAPVVALAEDHAFPDPDWARVLIEAHRGDFAAVGPGVRNANPATAVSWADLLIGYAPWLLPRRAAEVDFLPGHNTSYRRDLLLSYGEELPAMMQAETLLHWDLRRRGLRLRFEPAAVVHHTNFSLWSSWLPIQLHNGRLFAGSRARGMSPALRHAYFLAAPLIPAVRLLRIGRELRGRGLWGSFARSLPALAIGLILDGVGQMIGYGLGVGNAAERVARYEFSRVDHVTRRDREELFPEAPSPRAARGFV